MGLRVSGSMDSGLSGWLLVFQFGGLGLRVQKWLNLEIWGLRFRPPRSLADLGMPQHGGTLGFRV